MNIQEFFLDLIIFTLGVACILLWLVVFVSLAIEIYDFAIGDRRKKQEDYDNFRGTIEE